MNEQVSVSRLSLGRWSLVLIAAGYLTGLVLVANLAFGTSTFLNRHGNEPARTGGYDTRIPLVGAVDPDTIARSITEATGGAPTIGLPLPAAEPVIPKVASAAGPRITVTTTPTYTGATRVSTISWTSLLSLVPTNLTFPPRANPHRR